MKVNGNWGDAWVPEFWHWFCSRNRWPQQNFAHYSFFLLFLPRTHPKRISFSFHDDLALFLSPEHEILQAFPRRRLRRRRRPRRHGAGAHERDQDHGGPQKEEPRRLSTPPHVSFVFFFPSLVTK